MQRFTRLILFIMLLSYPAGGGTLLLRDGQSVSGDIALEGTRVIVTPKTGQPQGFELADIAQASFSPPPGPTTTYASPSREQTVRSPARRVLAEYFTDRDMAQMRLRRYESRVDCYLGTDSYPDPSLRVGFAARYTFRFVPPASGEYTFASDAIGLQRLWLDDQLVIDQWTPGGEKKGRASLAVVEKKPVNVRLEVTGASYGFKAGLRIYGEKIPNGYVGSDQMLPPAGAPAAPTVAFLSPARRSHYLRPGEVEFQIKAEDPDGKIVRVELYADQTLIGTATGSPYRVVWKNPAAGYHQMVARAVNDKTVSSSSEPLGVSIATAGDDASLPMPWGQQTLTEKKDHRPPGTVTFDNGTFKLSRAGGQITEGDDGFLFVFQALSGDFEVVARLASLTPPDNFVGPLAGLMIRDGLRADSRFASIVVSPTATTFVRKVEAHSKAASTSKETAPPGWLKMTRYANRVRVYTSSDGKEWSLHAGERLELPENLYVGMCGMARSRETPAIAVFDHVAISTGAPTLLHTTEGVLFRGGTFLACELHGLKENNIIFTRAGKRTTQTAVDVARLVYKAVPEELAEAIPSDRTGVLLGSGDFIEGELKEINYRVTVSNLVFGPRTFGVKTNDVLAIYLQDARAARTPYTLMGTDGSVYQAKSLKIEQDALLVDDAALGQIILPMKELAQLKVN